MKYSSDKQYNAFISNLVKIGDWTFFPKKGRKHGYLCHINTGKKFVVPCSPSDHRGVKNFISAIRRIERQPH